MFDSRIRDMARRLYIELTLDSPTVKDSERFKEAVAAAEFFESAWARHEQGLPIDVSWLADDD